MCFWHIITCLFLGVANLKIHLQFRFVSFAEEESATTALAHKGHMYKDMAIIVKPATKRRLVLFLLM